MTGKARSAIRRAVRLGALQRAVTLGEQVLMAVIEREALEMSEDEISALAGRFHMVDRNAMLAAIGEGHITAEDLSRETTALKGKRRRKGRLTLPVGNDAEGWFSLRNAEYFKFRMPGGQRAEIKKFATMVGFDFNMPVDISREGVVPGDRIIGIFHQTGRMEVYPMDSEALAEFHDKDVGWIDVRWDMAGKPEGRFKVVVSMYSQNRPGSLAQITGAIAACDANISNLVMRALAADSHELVFELEVRDLAQLTDVLATLKRTPGLSRVQRATIAQANAISGIEGALEPKAPETRETLPA